MIRDGAETYMVMRASHHPGPGVMQEIHILISVCSSRTSIDVLPTKFSTRSTIWMVDKDILAIVHLVTSLRDSVNTHNV